MILLFGALSNAALSDEYRLGQGDILLLTHAGVSEPVHLSVDVNGDIRIAPIGGVHVTGLPLDAAEDAIAQVMQAQGHFVDPAVSLSVLKYAPVVIGGDVMVPGRFDYTPGMTVAAALALSGGSQTRGLTQMERARGQAEAEAGMLTANLEIALATARVARFEARLKGPDAALSVEGQPGIPLPEQVDLAGIVETETLVLQGERTRAQQLLSFWENEIAAIETQAANFDARILVQSDIVQSTLAALETTQELAERGLQTGVRLATAEQRAADARSRVLELEAAKISAARAVSEAKRERVVFLANQEREALVGVQENKRALETAMYRYQRFAEQHTALSGVNAFADEDMMEVTFALQTQRQDRPKGAEITRDTPIMPGEVLIVQMSPLVDDLDG